MIELDWVNIFQVEERKKKVDKEERRVIIWLPSSFDTSYSSSYSPTHLIMSKAIIMNVLRLSFHFPFGNQNIDNSNGTCSMFTGMSYLSWVLSL